VISQIWEATTAKRTKIHQYCQRRNCSTRNILFSGV